MVIDGDDGIVSWREKKEEKEEKEEVKEGETNKEG